MGLSALSYSLSPLRGAVSFGPALAPASFFAGLAGGGRPKAGWGACPPCPTWCRPGARALIADRRGADRGMSLPSMPSLFPVAGPGLAAPCRPWRCRQRVAFKLLCKAWWRNIVAPWRRRRCCRRGGRDSTLSLFCTVTTGRPVGVATSKRGRSPVGSSFPVGLPVGTAWRSLMGSSTVGEGPH